MLKTRRRLDKQLFLLLSIAILSFLLMQALGYVPVIGSNVSQVDLMVDEGVLIQKKLLELNEAISRSDLDEAKIVLDELTEFAPDEAIVHYEMGLWTLFEDVDESIPYFEQAQSFDGEQFALDEFIRKIQRIKLSENEAHQTVLKGQALGSIDEWGWAEIAFAEAIEIEADYAEGWAFLGKAQEVNGKNGKLALEKAFQLNPKSVSVLVFLGDYFVMHDEAQRGIAHYQLAIQQAPNDVALYVGLANGYVLAGDLQSAIETLENAMQLAPESLLLKRTYVEFLVFFEVYLNEKALPTIDEMVELGEMAIVTNLYKGQIYLGLEKPETAKPFLASVVDFEPKNAEAHYYLGLCLLQLSEIDGAVSSFENALELDKTNQFGAQIEKLLEELR